MRRKFGKICTGGFRDMLAYRPTHRQRRLSQYSIAITADEMTRVTSTYMYICISTAVFQVSRQRQIRSEPCYESAKNCNENADVFLTKAQI